MHITLEHNLKELLDSLRVAPERVLRAQVQAVNDVAFDVRTEWQDEMRRKFDRVRSGLSHRIDRSEGRQEMQREGAPAGLTGPLRQR